MVVSQLAAAVRLCLLRVVLLVGILNAAGNAILAFVDLVVFVVIVADQNSHCLPEWLNVVLREQNIFNRPGNVSRVCQI